MLEPAGLQEGGVVLEDVWAGVITQEGGIILEDVWASVITQEGGVILEDSWARVITQEGGVILEDSWGRVITQEGGIILEDAWASVITQEGGIILEDAWAGYCLGRRRCSWGGLAISTWNITRCITQTLIYWHSLTFLTEQWTHGTKQRNAAFNVVSSMHYLIPITFAGFWENYYFLCACVPLLEYRTSSNIYARTQSGSNCLFENSCPFQRYRNFFSEPRIVRDLS
jgi:hypothetical protein